MTGKSEGVDAGHEAEDRRIRFRAITAVGIMQIITWGTSLYSLGVLGKSIRAETGWSTTVIYGGLTAGLLVGAAVSQYMGRLIDRRGGRTIMSIGAVVMAAGLLAVGASNSVATYFASWIILGLAMRMALYDAAFAAIVQVTPSRGRVAISYLTLFGGLASSVFWPIGQALDAAYGWRATYFIFAAINLVVCLPLSYWGLKWREHEGATALAASQSTTGAAGGPVLEGARRRMAMILFSIVISASAFVFGAMAAHLPAVVEAAGVTAVTAGWVASIKGVAQTGSRFVDLVFGRNLHPITLGRMTIAVIPLSFAAWFFGSAGIVTALAFSILFGITNGLTTIVRGAVPLALFGAKGYGEVLGILATPYLVLNAVAPVLFALLLDAAGMRFSVGVLLVVGLVATVAMEIMAAWYRRGQAGDA